MKKPIDFEIPEFGRDFLEPGRRLSRIGSGAVGGKASSLFLTERAILAGFGDPGPSDIEVDVPAMTVLTTEVFDLFMKQGGLYEIALSGASDEEIALAFQQAKLPAQFVGDLLSLSTAVKSPLAVRSSSLLEDDLLHPFAGVYATKMIPNNQPEPQRRFERLVEAIKLVYASTFFRAAKEYASKVGGRIEDEKMAVVIQEVVGERRGDRFYPTLSGVARSYSYYPLLGALPEEGVVNLALGLGKTIVDGGRSWTYCPSWPNHPPPFRNVGDQLKSTQTRFWAVWMGEPPLPDPVRETEYLVEAELAEAEADDTLRFLASTCDPASGRLSPGVGARGARLLDFARILRLEEVPLNDLVRKLLASSEEALGGPVEIEFAVNLDPRRGLPARLGFLQVRPMAVSEGHVNVTLGDLVGEDVVLGSRSVMGNGALEDVRDVVFLKPDSFEPSATRTIAAELQTVDHRLRGEGRPYLLIGFGRWGTADPWLGVPVDWTQICGAAAIVEAALPRMCPDPSQGSHFFQNMIAFGVLYLTVAGSGDPPIDWGWLNEQPCVSETGFVKHVRTPDPLHIRVDGRNRMGVVKRHE